MRILGLDYGSKKIGLAVSDELGVTAQAVCVIARKNMERDLEQIADYVSRYRVEKIVVGYPLRLDGSEGVQCGKVNRFIERLSARFLIPVVRWDETLSTREAEDILTEANISRKKRKSVVDKIAAGIILQSYLDHLRAKNNFRAPSFF
ncbi:MAG: Holliday junction resolvase RuvX [Syntrophales bacterium]